MHLRSSNNSDPSICKKRPCGHFSYILIMNVVSFFSQNQCSPLCKSRLHKKKTSDGRQDMECWSEQQTMRGEGTTHFGTGTANYELRQNSSWNLKTAKINRSFKNITDKVFQYKIQQLPVIHLLLIYTFYKYWK